VSGSVDEKVGPRCSSSKLKKVYFKRTGSQNKRRGRAGSSKMLITMKTQNKAMKTRKQNYGQTVNKTMNKYYTQGYGKTVRQETRLNFCENT